MRRHPRHLTVPGIRLWLGPLWVLFVSWFALPSDAATIYVNPDGSGDATTIQLGIQMVAANGDTVLVAPGQYTETLSSSGPMILFNRGGAVLLSERGPAYTTINPLGDPLASAALEISGTGAVLDGFTITGTANGAHGVDVQSTSGAIVRNCEFRDIPGFAVNADRHDVDLTGCRFVGCGRGIYQDRAAVNITDCVFELCYDTAVVALGSSGFTNARIAITNCTFRFNSAANQFRAGAVDLLLMDSWTITGCHFEGNLSESGGGAIDIKLGTTANPPIVQDNVFLFNRSTAPQSPGGALATEHPTTVRGNTFYGNEDAGGGGSAVSLNTDGCTLENNLFARASSRSPAVHATGSVTSACNLFWETPGGVGNGYEPTLDDFEGVDPLFCDESSLDLTVAQNSIALPAQSPQCGQIGALGQGCAIISVQALSWGAIKAQYR